MMPPNTQPPERLSLDTDGKLQVNSIFLTVQGEGPHAGVRAVFVRLAGCNLKCPGCDTEYSRREEMSPAQVLGHVSRLAAPPGGDPGPMATLVVVTGGEPFRQNVAPLARLLCRDGYTVQFETNGTLPPPEQGDGWWAVCEFVVSPKAPAVNGFFLRPDLRSRGLLWWKYPVRAGGLDPVDGLPLAALGGMRPCRPPATTLWLTPDRVFLTPEDSYDPAENRANAREAYSSCVRRGYRFGVQLHKIAGAE